MVYLSVVGTLGWIFGCFTVAVGWWHGEPAFGERLITAMAMVYAALHMISVTLDTLDAAALRKDRHLDRRPQI